MRTATATSSATSRATQTAQPSLWGRDPLGFDEVVAGAVRTLDAESFVLHHTDWLRGADTAFEEIATRTQWQRLRRQMYDRIVDVPRLVATVDVANLASGSALAAIAAQVARLFGTDIEHVGLNYYRNGNDSVAWHRDRIGDARDWSLVALVSLGGPRELQLRRFRHPEAPSGPRALHGHTLHSGDLFVMGGACQRDWEHRVRKVRAAAPRISIAFRTKQFPQGPLFQHRGVTP